MLPRNRRTKTSPGEPLRKIIIAPTTLQDTAPLDYIEATIAAGYDGIGLRVHRSPGLPFHPVVGDAALIREMRARLAGLPVFDLYSFYLQPDTDVASFAPAMELGASFGAKYATVMGADDGLVAPARQFHQDLRSRDSSSA